jgi:hypothetical protein
MPLPIATSPNLAIIVKDLPRMPPKTLNLGPLESAFSKGGNRLCFIHPENPDLIIKIPRPDRTPEIKRVEKSFPKSLKPLATFDDNKQEEKVYRTINRHIGQEAYKVIPRCHGFVDTNLGRGLCSDLIRNDTGEISITLKQKIWTEGVSDSLTATINQFLDKWVSLGMPSRNLLLHNIVIEQNQEKPDRLMVIDGLGWPDTIPLAYFIPRFARRKAKRRAILFQHAIDSLLKTKQDNGSFGFHGWLSDTPPPK